MIGKNPRLIETSSLRSFNSSFSDSTSLLSLNVALNHDSNVIDKSKSEKNNHSQIAENFLLLDRLNQRQRQKQLLQSKKDLHRQQLNELKHKQLNLEQKFVQPKNIRDSNVFNSKLASHYSLSSNLSNDICDKHKSSLNFPIKSSKLSINTNERISPIKQNKIATEASEKTQNFSKLNKSSDEKQCLLSDPERNFRTNKSTDLFMLKKSVYEINSKVSFLVYL